MPKPDTKRYFNRELSWLSFNERVLEQALEEKYPLLERVRYLSFVSSNLDEFFEIRVAGLLQQADAGISEISFDGMSVKDQLKEILKRSQELVKEQYRCWEKILIPKLKKEGICFKKADMLTEEEHNWLSNYFDEEVYPVLTPLAVDTTHPFPQLTHKSLNALISLKEDNADEDSPIMAIIPVPRILPRVVRVELEGAHIYIFLSDIIRIFSSRLFPGYTVQNTWDFRITRNSDLYFDEEESENLLQKIEEELRKIRKGKAVRLEIRSGSDPTLLSELLRVTELSSECVFQVDGPVNLQRLFSVYDLIDRPDLKFAPFKPHTPATFSNSENIFDNIDREDVLLHHPYDAFTPVVDFIETAANDAGVLAIKQTLYRTSGDSPIVAALKDASLAGKQVTALIELKARFDEANNIEWARQLEEAGVHVVYGQVGLKTHCKCCLIVRKESEGLKRYVHLGTGNYNPKTAKSYTDLSLFTADATITEEVANIFNSLTGLARSPVFKKLWVAPFNLHKNTQTLIDQEIKNAKAGKPAHIIAKLNNLVDQETIDHLYKASQAGVEIDLIIRGICCLIPGAKGLSETIRVHSILGQYLEHSRVFYFENGNDEPLVYLGSADWMPRNFYRRIEVAFPISSNVLRKHIIDNILSRYLEDTEDKQMLNTDGTFRKPKNEIGSSAQQKLKKEAELQNSKPL